MQFNDQIILKVRAGVSIFSRKLTIFNFWTKLTQKIYFQSKIENSGNHHRILHIRISLGSRFQLQQFWFFGRNSQKRAFPIKNRKNEPRHWVMHIRISLNTKFQLKLIILIFWTKFWFLLTTAKYLQNNLFIYIIY